MKYEKPDLEEMELLLEGSFLAGNSLEIGKEDDEAKSEEEWDD